MVAVVSPWVVRAVDRPCHVALLGARAALRAVQLVPVVRIAVAQPVPVLRTMVLLAAHAVVHPCHVALLGVRAALPAVQLVPAVRIAVVQPVPERQAAHAVVRLCRVALMARRVVPAAARLEVVRIVEQPVQEQRFAAMRQVVRVAFRPCRAVPVAVQLVPTVRIAMAQPALVQTILHALPGRDDHRIVRVPRPR